MKMKFQLKLFALCPLLSALCLCAHAQGTAFTYQGRLNNGASSANGAYDLRFAIYDSVNAGTQQGSLLTNTATAVNNGLFAVTLDFGNQFPGANRWLEIGVRTNGGGIFTTLAPRQPFTPTPYAIFATSAGSATTATTAGSAGSMSATNLTGALTTSQLPAGTVVALTNGGGPYQILSSSFNGGVGGLTNIHLTKSIFGNANHLRFTDTVGSEEVWLHAAKNMNLETVNDATFWAGHNFLTTIDYDVTFHAKHDENFTVDNNLTDTIGVNYSLSIGNNFTTSVGNSMNLSVGSNLGIFTGGGVGLGTATPSGRLHVYSADNPTVVRIQSTGTPGFGRLEFASNPQGDVNEWRPGYLQSTDAGGFTGGLAFCVNGTGVGSKFGSVEVMRLVNGNVGIGTTSPSQKLEVIGNILASGTITGSSDRNVKEHFASVNPRDVLEKVSALPITEWNYKADNETLRHIGPMAQDFYSAFNVGLDDKHISMVDADGVALAAIQGLNQKLEETRQAARTKDEEILALKQQNDALAERLNELEKTVSHLATQK